MRTLFVAPAYGTASVFQRGCREVLEYGPLFFRRLLLFPAFRKIAYGSTFEILKKPYIYLREISMNYAAFSQRFDVWWDIFTEKSSRYTGIWVDFINLSIVYKFCVQILEILDRICAPIFEFFSKNRSGFYSGFWTKIQLTAKTHHGLRGMSRILTLLYGETTKRWCRRFGSKALRWRIIL